MSEKRKLDLRTLNQLADDITCLRRGYTKVGGTWTLEQACDHCAKPLYYLTQPIDTNPPTDDQKKVQAFLTGLIEKRVMEDNRPLPPGTAPADDAGTEAIDRLLAGLKALDTHRQSHVTFSTIGTITTEQFKQFFIVHTQHHLNFFQPTI